jgi:hypothetical protein
MNSPELNSRVRVRVTLRLAVYRQSIRLGDKPLETHDSSFFIFQLNICDYSPYVRVTSSLTRGWVCLLQLLLVHDSAVILSSESRGTHDHILLSQIRDPPTSTLESVTCPPFVLGMNQLEITTSNSSSTDACLLVTDSILASCRLAMEYSASISCRGNVC